VEVKDMTSRQERLGDIVLVCTVVLHMLFLGPSEERPDGVALASGELQGCYPQQSNYPSAGRAGTRLCHACGAFLCELDEMAYLV